MPKLIDRIWLAVYVLLVVALACGDFYLPVQWLDWRGLAIAGVCLVGIAHVRTRWVIGDYDTHAEELRAKHELDSSKHNP